MVKHISEGELLEMKEMDEKLSTSIKFFNFMMSAAYLGKPKREMMIFFLCKMVQLTIKNGLCKHSILAFIKFAALLTCNKLPKIGGCFDIGLRIGKAALSCSTKRYHTSEQLSNLNFVYYTNIAFHTEPLQTCADMFRQGFDTSMSLGDSGTAFFHSIHHIRTGLQVGDRLPTLLRRVDYYLDLANTYQNEVAKEALAHHRETILALIEHGGSISSASTVEASTNMESSQMLAGLYFLRATQAYWQGHYERCQYFIGKFSIPETFDPCRELSMRFIEGMNSFQVLKLKSKLGRGRNTLQVSKQTVLEAISNAILALKTAASRSSWNFQNKVRYNHLSTR